MDGGVILVTPRYPAAIRRGGVKRDGAFSCDILNAGHYSNKNLFE